MWCFAAAFENIVQALYSNVVPKPKSECSKTEQLGVSFAAGYLAGILCATISHPADNLVSKLNASKVMFWFGIIDLLVSKSMLVTVTFR